MFPSGTLIQLWTPNSAPGEPEPETPNKGCSALGIYSSSLSLSIDQWIHLSHWRTSSVSRYAGDDLSVEDIDSLESLNDVIHSSAASCKQSSVKYGIESPPLVDTILFQEPDGAMQQLEVDSNCKPARKRVCKEVFKGDCPTMTL